MRSFGETEVTSVSKVPKVVIMHVCYHYFNIKMKVLNMQPKTTLQSTMTLKLCVVEYSVLPAIFWFWTFPDLQFLMKHGVLEAGCASIFRQGLHLLWWIP
jgi:hypothetical protein